MVSFQEFTDYVRDAAGKSGGNGKSIKIVLDEGVVLIDRSGETPVVSNEDKEADATVITSLATLQAIQDGDLNPMMALMTGKIKVKGDMGAAMQLQNILG